MNHSILKLSTVILLFALLTAGCKKNDIFELQIGDENAIIKHEGDGIEFKFCLLNELGQPATVFNEGENFSFHFAIKNNRDESIYFDNSLLNVDGFCKVQNNKQSFGMPYKKPVFINTIGLFPIEIAFNQIQGKQIPWILDEDMWQVGFISYQKNKNDKLMRGKYFTEFSHKFDLHAYKTNKLTFKINFEIR